MDSCCKEKYQNVFDAAGAKKEMADYLAKGVKKSSRPLAETLKSLPLKDCTLLDIGAGIGALIFESFEKGLRKATYVDIAEAYRQIFLQEVEKRALEAKVSSQSGDFVELHQHDAKA